MKAKIVRHTGKYFTSPPVPPGEYIITTPEGISAKVTVYHVYWEGRLLARIRFHRYKIGMYFHGREVFFKKALSFRF